MSIQGKVQTLFADREKTNAIFPATKTSAVSDKNGRNLDAILEDKASKEYVSTKIAEAQLDGNETIDLSGYATKDDLNNIEYPVNSVNNKFGAVQLVASDVGAVPTTRKVNGKVLSSDISLSATDVGAAPAGYGLGTIATSVSDLNHAVANGWYSFYTSTANAPYMGYGVVETIVRVEGDTILQIAYDLVTSASGYFNYDVSAQRRFRNGAWQPWEYINPPMIPGIEYRTTERYDGKSVYTMLINAGAITASGEITKRIQGLTSGIRYAGRVGPCPVPVLQTTQIYVDTYENNVTIGWVCGHEDWIGRPVECQLWYLKD